MLENRNITLDDKYYIFQIDGQKIPTRKIRLNDLDCTAYLIDEDKYISEGNDVLDTSLYVYGFRANCDELLDQYVLYPYRKTLVTAEEVPEELRDLKVSSKVKPAWFD